MVTINNKIVFRQMVTNHMVSYIKGGIYIVGNDCTRNSTSSNGPCMASRIRGDTVRSDRTYYSPSLWLIYKHLSVN